MSRMAECSVWLGGAATSTQRNGRENRRTKTLAPPFPADSPATSSHGRAKLRSRLVGPRLIRKLQYRLLLLRQAARSQRIGFLSRSTLALCGSQRPLPGRQQLAKRIVWPFLWPQKPRMTSRFVYVLFAPPNVELTCLQLMARLLRMQEACHEPDGRVQRLVRSR